MWQLTAHFSVTQVAPCSGMGLETAKIIFLFYLLFFQVEIIM